MKPVSPPTPPPAPPPPPEHETIHVAPGAGDPVGGDGRPHTHATATATIEAGLRAEGGEVDGSITTPDDPTVTLGGKLAGLSLSRQVFVLAVWPFFQQLLNWMVSAVDTAIAGRLSVEAANAIGVTAYIGWLLGLLTMAVGSGASALISRAIGGRHRGLANAGLGQALLIAVVWGTAVGAAIFMGARGIGHLAGLRGESLDMAAIYLQIQALATPFAGLLFVGSASLSGAGDTRSPFWVMLMVNLVNATLSIGLVVMGHGVAGIAAGTAIAWVVGSLITLAVLIRHGGPIRLRAARLRPEWGVAKRILRVAGPNLVDRIGQWSGNFLVIMIVGYIATQAIAPGSSSGASGDSGGGGALWGAHIVAIRIEAISFLPGMAFGIAASTLAGQYLGAGSPRLARRAVTYCWLIGASIMTLTGLSFMAFPEAWTRLMSNQPEILELTPQLLRICGLVQFFFGSQLILSEAIRGAGDTRWPMILGNVSTWCFRLPGAWLLGVTMGLGLVGVWYALCGELVLRGLLYIGRFYHGGWLRVRV